MANIIELVCTGPMKRKEEAERALKLEALESQIDQINLEIQATQKREKRDALKT